MDATEAQPAVAAARKIPWGPVSAVLMAILAFFASEFIGIFLISIYAARHGLSGALAQDWLTNSIPAQFFLTLIIETVAVGLLILFLKHRQAKAADLGLVRPRLRDVGYVLAGFAVYFLSYVALAVAIKILLPSLNLDQSQDIGFKTANGSLQLGLVFLSLAVLPPLAEEFIFRGFMYSGLRTKLKPLLAALITSVIFGSAHLQFGSQAPLLWVAFIDTFVLSMVMVYMRERSGSLWPCIGLHMLKNTVAFLTLFVFAGR